MSSLINALCLAFFTINFPVVEAELNTSTDKKTTRLSGVNVTFKCQTTSSTENIRWQFTGIAQVNATTVRIHTGQRFLRQFENQMSENFDVTNRESALTIIHVDRNDSGIYACLETNSVEHKIEFTLVVNTVVEKQATTDATSGTNQHSTAPNTKSQSLSPAEIVLTVALISTAGIMACVFVVVLLSRRRKKHSPRQHRPVVVQHTSVAVPVAYRPNHEIEINSGLNESRTPTVPPRAHVYRSNQELYVNTTGQQAAANIDDDDIDPMYAQVAGRRNDGQQLVVGRAQSRPNIASFM